ncbi:MAG: mechanosensitive ion channel domain-containing protein [Bacteroidota bacterium]
MQFVFLQANVPSDGIDLIKVLTDLVSSVVSGIPQFLGALIVLLVGWIIARSIRRLVKRLLVATGIDKLAENLNSIELVERANIKIYPSQLLSSILYYLLMLIVAMASTELLGMPQVSQLMTDIINYVPNLITALIVLVLGLLFSDFIKNLVLTACRSLGIPSANLIANVVFYFLFIAVAMSALGQARINTDFIQSNLTVIIGGAVLAFSFGYGFASRDMMANFIASFYSKSKVKIGDRIRIEEVEGEVVGIDNTSITVKGNDRQIIIPLSKLTSENVEIFD